MNDPAREPLAEKSHASFAVTAGLLGLALTAWAPAASAACTLTGSGNAGSPYLVTKYTDLVQVGLDCGMAATYKLTKNIDTVGKAGVPFSPIGTSPDTTIAFSGTLLGAGFTIDYLSINDSFNLDVGLIGELKGGTVDSLTLKNVNIFGRVNNVGGIAGRNLGTIKGCYVLGVINGSRNGVVGGIVGENGGTVLRSSSLVLTTTDSGSYVGGIAGLNDSDGVVEQCYSRGSIVSKVYNNVMGGVVGYNYGTVARSYSVGRINGGSMSYVGGVVGENAGFVDSCWLASSGRVYSTSESQVGGIVGMNDSGSIVSQSWTEGPVVCDYSCRVGGVVGENTGSILTSFATDSVHGGNNSIVGGVAGLNGIGCVIKGSYSLGGVSTVDSGTVGGVAGENGGVIRVSYGSGSVKGRYSSRVGGVAGNNEATGSIADAYAVGSIGGGILSTVGGLIAENRGDIARAYAVSTVAAAVGSEGLLGGAIGMNGPGGKMSSVYWNSAVSKVEIGTGSDVQGGANGVAGNLNTTLMHDSTNYVGFDFLKVWSIVQGTSYPNLAGVKNSPFVPVGPRANRLAKIATARIVGGDLVMELPGASEIRILDLQGRQILAAGRLEAGLQTLSLPRTSKAVIAQIRSAGKLMHLVVDPVR